LIIVALTKVDRVQPGDQKYWLDILHQGAGRYFVTRLHAPDIEGNPQRTWDEDREDENTLLSNAPWCKADRRILGSKKLIRSVGKRLAELIKKRFNFRFSFRLIFRLPKLAQEIEDAKSSVDEDLRSLPESFAENPQGKLLNLFAEFISSVKERTAGKESDSQLLVGLYNEFERLASGITSTRLDFEISSKHVHFEPVDPNNPSKSEVLVAFGHPSSFPAEPNSESNLKAKVESKMPVKTRREGDRPGEPLCF
jgi:hypothetical protein